MDTNTEQCQINRKLNGLEKATKDHQNPLDSSITDQEIYKKLQALTFKKACRPDGILNEILKFTCAKCQLAILKLFNLILSVGYFPDIWNLGLITPIFKNGDKIDPNNYRGICVNSNLGKVFCSIIIMYYKSNLKCFGKVYRYLLRYFVVTFRKLEPVFFWIKRGK